MSELCFYRPNAELTAALRECVRVRDEHVERVVKPWVAEHPDQAPWGDRFERVIGFADGKPNEPPPTGLSRNRQRSYLIPTRNAAGKPWREAMDKLTSPGHHTAVLHRFGIREQLRAEGMHTYLCFPDFVDYGDDEGGLIVYISAPLSPVPPAVTPMLASEFYLIKEAYEARHPRPTREVAAS